MGDYQEIPHIYQNKRFIGLSEHDIKRGNPQYLYVGGTEITSVIKHLNNVNTITSHVLLIVNSIASKIGIKTNCFKDQAEDLPVTGRGLLELLDNIEPIKTDLELSPVMQKLELLEQKIANLENKIGTLDPSSLQRLLLLCENIDSKT